MFFLFLESIGTTEVIFIALIALVVFGPRRLPELGRKLGRTVGDFRRASEDFKRTWEAEVETERIAQETKQERTLSALSEADLSGDARPAFSSSEDSARDSARTIAPNYPSPEPSAIARTSKPSNISGSNTIIPPTAMDVTEVVVPTAPARRED